MKAKLFALFVALLMVGCGGTDWDDPVLREIDLDDPETLDKIIAEAIDGGTLWRRGSTGKELYYAPDKQTPYTGWVKSSYKNGEIRNLAEFKDGEARGSMILWHENGQKFSAGKVKKGKPDGLLTKWYANGQKREEGSFMEGKMHGPWTWWHENGNKKNEINYKGGKKMGLSQGWDRDGGKLSKENFQDGLLVGKASYWYPGNKIMNEMTYDNGKLMAARVWQPNGTECPFTKIEKGNGVLVYYQFDGKMDKIYYSDGVEVEAEEYKGENGLIPTRMKFSFKDPILGERDSLPSAKTFFKESRIAAVKGNPIAQFRIANLHLQGTGTPKNKTKAYAWLSVAHASGHEDALEVRESLALSKEEIVKAKQLKIQIQKQMETNQATDSRSHSTHPISSPETLPNNP